MDLLQYTFFQNALIGSLLACIACGIIGTYIVTRRLVFISGGITHASFGGIGLGVFFGINPILSGAIFAILSACGIQWFSQRRDVRADSAIAVFWTFGMSLGIIFCYLTPGIVPDLTSYLFGNILTITQSDLWLLTAVDAAAIVLVSFFFPTLLAVAFDKEHARSQRLPVNRVEYGMMIGIALTIIACLRMVGIVLVISLLTLPQMTANLFTYKYKKIMFWSIVIGFLSCLGGLWFSFLYNIPSGASIIFTSILIYAVCKVYTAIRQKIEQTQVRNVQ
jgi:zinc transport system permease protein